jgi:hypothetical protein
MTTNEPTEQERLRNWWNSLHPYWVRVMKIKLKPEYEWNKTGRDNFIPSDGELDALVSSDRLEIRGASVNDLEPLRIFSSLKSLDLGGLQNVKSLEPLRDLKKIEFLSLSTGLSDLSVVNALSALNSFSLASDKIENLRFLSSINSIQRIWITSPTLLTLEGIEASTELEELYLTQLMVADLTPITHLAKIKKLKLDKININNLEPLRNLVGLTELEINNAPVRELKGLETLLNLTHLRITSCAIVDGGIFAFLTHLQSLCILHTQITNLESLYHLPHLRQIQISERKFSKEEILKFKDKQPDCEILTEHGRFPFRSYELYKVKKSFQSRESKFIEGRVLEYTESETNTYDGIEIVYFKDTVSNKSLRWDMWPNDLEDWGTYLEVVVR